MIDIGCVPSLQVWVRFSIGHWFRAVCARYGEFFMIDSDFVQSLQEVLRELGPNDVGAMGQLIEINSEHKTVRGHQYK